MYLYQFPIVDIQMSVKLLSCFAHLMDTNECALNSIWRLLWARFESWKGSRRQQNAPSLPKFLCHSDGRTDYFHSIGYFELMRVNISNLSSFDTFCKMASGSPSESVIVHVRLTASAARPTKRIFNALPFIMYKFTLINIKY